MKLEHGLGVQSYCFRGFKKHEDVIAKVNELELKAIEICRVHVNFDDPSVFDEAIQAYRNAGIQIVSIGIETLSGDRAKDETKFQFAKAAGCRFMGVNFQLDTLHSALKTAQELAEEYDLKLAIHNHGGRHWLGSAQALDYVFRQSGPRIGLCLDTAWALHSHENPVEMAKRFGERLYGVHFKDFTFEPTGAHKEAIVGKGNLDLPALFNVLNEIDFNGYGVLEYEADVDNPVPALKQCVDSVREIMN
ncbi:MAG: sugar phosphate isomerase/epimerase [Lentisphaerae bacterium]|nr:MAG: sugar phosphate isomerase/epimerase [Lentisphaerota bacterium]